MSSERSDGPRSKKRADERRSASETHDAQFFKDRKAMEESNLELTLKLRAQRLAHAATQPKKPEAKSPVRRTRADRDED